MANISLVARNSSCNLINQLIDAGTIKDSGYIVIRSGTLPASPQAAPNDGLALATLILSNPAFGTSVNGVATANLISPDVSIANTGTATWFRIYNRDDGAVIDGTVTATGGGGDLMFDSVEFVKGGTVQINRLTATVPQ